MAKKQSYTVTYKTTSSEVCTKTLKAEDEACALGLLLDGEDDDAELEFVLIRRASTALFGQLPNTPAAQVLRAYEEGLAEQ